MHARREFLAVAFKQSDGVRDMGAGNMFLIGIKQRQRMSQKIERFAQPIAICSFNHAGPRLN